MWGLSRRDNFSEPQAGLGGNQSSDPTAFCTFYSFCPSLPTRDLRTLEPFSGEEVEPQPLHILMGMQGGSNSRQPRQLYA